MINTGDEHVNSPNNAIYNDPYLIHSPQPIQHNNFLQVHCQQNPIHTEESKEEFDSPNKIMYAELIRQNNHENAANFEQLTRNTGKADEQNANQNRFGNDYSDYGKKQLSTVEEENAS